jgi:1-acyl-sn-glycerol-3-phosphate acyltransferase
VALEGAGRVLPPDGFRPRPGTIRLTVGAPIPTVGLQRDDRADLARRAEEAVADLLAAMQA